MTKRVPLKDLLGEDSTSVMREDQVTQISTTVEEDTRPGSKNVIVYGRGT